MESTTTMPRSHDATMAEKIVNQLYPPNLPAVIVSSCHRVIVIVAGSEVR